MDGDYGWKPLLGHVEVCIHILSKQVSANDQGPGLMNPPCPLELPPWPPQFGSCGQKAHYNLFLIAPMPGAHDVPASAMRGMIHSER